MVVIKFEGVGETSRPENIFKYMTSNQNEVDFYGIRLHMSYHSHIDKMSESLNYQQVDNRWIQRKPPAQLTVIPQCAIGTVDTTSHIFSHYIRKLLQ